MNSERTNLVRVIRDMILVVRDPDPRVARVWMKNMDSVIRRESLAVVQLERLGPQYVGRLRKAAQSLDRLRTALRAMEEGDWSDAAFSLTEALGEDL